MDRDFTVTAEQVVIVTLSATACIVLLAALVWKAKEIARSYTIWRYSGNSWNDRRGFSSLRSCNSKSSGTPAQKKSLWPAADVKEDEEIRWLNGEESDYGSELDCLTSLSSSRSDVSRSPTEPYTLLEECTQVSSVTDSRRKEDGLLLHEYLEPINKKMLIDKTPPTQAAEPLGKVHISIRYLATMTLLKLELIEAQDLPTSLDGNLPDPYFKVSLWKYVEMLHPLDALRRPSHSTRCQHATQKLVACEYHSKVVRATNAPVYEQIFEFQLGSQTTTPFKITLTAMSYNRYSRHEVIGEATIDLVSLDLSKETNLWRDLSLTSHESRGELLVSLNYLPTTERLYVVIIKARSLSLEGLSDLLPINPYVRVTMLCHGKKVKKRKTSIKRNDPNPMYNESLTFDVPSEQLGFVKFIITVLHERHTYGGSREGYERDRASSFQTGLSGTTSLLEDTEYWEGQEIAEEQEGDETIQSLLPDSSYSKPYLHSNHGDNDVIGYIILGPRSHSGVELAHWTEMLHSPRRPVAQWHTLTSPSSSSVMFSKSRGGVGRRFTCPALQGKAMGKSHPEGN